MLSVNDLSFKYKDEQRYALRKISFKCESEGVIAIIGRSGVGKSTLISVLAGIYTSGDRWLVGEFTGEILLDGYEPGRNCGPNLISWVPQVPVLLDHLSVLDNVLLPLTIIKDVSPSESKEAEALLNRLDLKVDYRKSRPRDLSGGEKTRVSLVRALISQPKYLFMDEPFISLDLGNRQRIYELLREKRAGNTNGPTTTVLTTHNIPEAFLLANQIIIMEKKNDETDETKMEVRVESNKPRLAADGGDRGVHLKAAREAAARIEKSLFLV